MSEHTQEPWHTVKGIDRRWRIHSETVSHMAVLGESGKQDARRIVACVNACEGISTETLEKVRLADVEVIQDALRDCVALLDESLGYVTTNWMRNRADYVAQIEAAITNARKALGEEYKP